MATSFESSVLEAADLKMEEISADVVALLIVLGMPKEPLEAKENPLEAGGLKGDEVGLNCLAPGFKFDESLFDASPPIKVLDRDFSRVCSSSESSMNRGSLSDVEEISAAGD